MQLLKTVKRFVAGSEKIFDIYSCTVDAVDEYISDSGRQMIGLEIENLTYTGLYNNWVYDYVCSNEGTPSFVVMWRSPKGKPMVAYVRQIWEDHIKGVYNVEVDESTEAYSNKDAQAFVYMWVNHDDDRKYIGCHTGKPDDGYIASGEEFLDAYSKCPDSFVRTILAYGSTQQMLELETILLLQLGTRMSPMYYNLSNNLAK